MQDSTDSPIDYNPVVVVWAAKPDGEGFGGFVPDTERPLWRGPLKELRKHNGAPHKLLMSDESRCWSAFPALGMRAPLNGYRL